MGEQSDVVGFSSVSSRRDAPKRNRLAGAKSFAEGGRVATRERAVADLPVSFVPQHEATPSTTAQACSPPADSKIDRSAPPSPLNRHLTKNGQLEVSRH
jgi:hypothetical protein